jgi:uroporphyrinogen-III synthase
VVFASASAVDGFALSAAPRRIAAAVAIGDATAARAWTLLGIEARMARPDDDEIAMAVRALVMDRDAVAGR